MNEATRLTLVARACDFAKEKHANQKDKLEQPYMGHLSAVAAGVRLLGGSIEEIAAAYLHDVVEDVAAVTYATLLEEFPPSVVKIVWAVTKQSGEQQEDYLDRILKVGESAIRVKVADLMHNLRPDRLAQLPEYTQSRLKKKYQPSLARLLMELGYLQSKEDQDTLLATSPIGSSVWTGSDFTGYSSPAKDQWFTGAQLMKGDWLAGHAAPIEKETYSVGDLRYFKLTNGASWSAVTTKKFRCWSNTAVKERQKTEPNWTPAQELQVLKVQSITTGKKK